MNSVRQQLNEQRIKATFVDWLSARGALDDAVLINEFVVANFSRRADLAVANGKLLAYEVKSDSDTLRRLPGQLEVYLQRFDKVTVVTTPRFVRQVLESSPSRVGVIEASVNALGVVEFRVARKGVVQDVTARNILAGYLLKKEIAQLLKQNRQEVDSNASRETLTSQLEAVSVAALRVFVLSAMKRRYGNSSAWFLSQKNERTEPDDLRLLSRFRQLRVNESALPAQPQDMLLSDERRTIDVEAIAAKWGPLPEGTPGHVLIRIDRRRRHRRPKH